MSKITMTLLYLLACLRAVKSHRGGSHRKGGPRPSAGQCHLCFHIAPSHPFLVFDHSQPGIGFSEPRKGVLGPARGLHVKLGDYESLVVFSGASELKLADHGMPRQLS
jgi:hypothetical protein